MEEFIEEKIADTSINESPETRKDGTLISPYRLGVSPELMMHNRESFAIQTPVYKKPSGPRDSIFPGPSNMNQGLMGRPSVAPHLNANGKSFSIDVGGVENISPSGVRSRFATEQKKKEFWKKSATRINKKLEIKCAGYIAKVLRRLKGLVSLKLNLSGWEY